MLINVKMPTIVGILTVISMINATTESLKARKLLYSSREVESSCLAELSMKKVL